MDWSLWTTTKTNRRVNVPFKSLSINRNDAISEAQSRYGTNDVHLIPENKTNIATGVVTSDGSSDPLWQVFGIFIIFLLYYWWGLILPLLAWWSYKRWISVEGNTL